jgi:acyl-CoA thioesterase FadM
MLDSLPFTFRDTHIVVEVDISYLAQTYRDDTVFVQTGVIDKTDMEKDEVLLFHEVVRKSSGNEVQQVSVASTKWKRRPVES